MNEMEKAKRHALIAYKSAWADGEPYVYRVPLTEMENLLRKMDVQIPKLPDYDPEMDKKYPWEDEIETAIRNLLEEKKQENEKKDE